MTTNSDCADIAYLDRNIAFGIGRFSGAVSPGGADGLLTPGEELNFRLIASQATSALTPGTNTSQNITDSVRSLIPAVLLAPGLTYVTGSESYIPIFAGSGFDDINTANPNQPILEVIHNYMGTGRELVRWTFEEDITPFITYDGDKWHLE